MNASVHYQLRHCAVYRPPTHSHALRSIIQWCLHFAWLEFNSFPAICTWPVQTNKLQCVFSHHCSLLPFSTWLLSDDLEEVWVFRELFVSPLTIWVKEVWSFLSASLLEQRQTPFPTSAYNRISDLHQRDSYSNRKWWLVVILCGRAKVHYSSIAC